MSTVPATEFVSVAARFRRSASLELDYGRVELLADYIVSPLAGEVTTRICRDLATPGGNRAWSLVGPYGSGKSSFLTFLASFLSEEKLHVAASTLLAQQWKVGAIDAIRPWSKLEGHLVPVVITGSRSPLGSAVLKGVLQAAERFWARSAAPPIVEQLSTAAASSEIVSDTNRIVDLVAAFAEQVRAARRRSVGVVLFIDEMGKFLEYAAQNPSATDIYLLQQLAEVAGRVPGPGLSLLTVLHQDFEEYAGSLPAVAQAEWAKVRGRYETITFLESPAHLLKLMARAIDHRAGYSQTTLFRANQVHERAESVSRLARGDDPERAKHLEACFPLNPVVALCVGPLFRLRLGQNERSLFSFLASNEPGGFQSYLKHAGDRTEERPYCLDHLYDYVVDNTTARAGGGGRARIWAATEEAIARLPKDAEALDERILKALAVLAATADAAGLSASKEVLSLGLTESADKVGRRVDRLKEASLLVYRKYKQGYQVWDGSDLDIDQIIERSAETVRSGGGFAAQIQRLYPAFPVVASRHYHHTGTLRFLDARYVSPDQVGSPIDGPAAGDGSLLLVLPDREDQLRDIELRLPAQKAPRRARPTVVALPGTVGALLDGVVDVLAIDHALKNTPELDGDPVARRELEVRRNNAADALSSAIARSFGSDRAGSGVRWFYNGEVRSVAGRPSAAASAIFDEVYKQAPKILNELVNREELSSAAAAARHTLMKLMLTSSDQEQLGIDGHPPELSLYRSVLSATRLHREVEGQWQLTEPSEPLLRKLFEHLEQLIGRKPGKQLSFADLMQELRAPPYGVRPGVSLILIFAWYLLNEDRLFLYEDGGLVPVVSEDLIQRLLRVPELITLQLPTGSRGADEAVTLLAQRLAVKRSKGRGEGLFDVVRGIITVIRRLSPYAAQTQELGQPARVVRSAVKSAKDPVRLLWTDLPIALNFQSFDQPEMSQPGAAERFADGLVQALAELQGADRVLLQRIERTLRDLLRVDEEGMSFYAVLVARAHRLAESPELPTRVQQWVDLTRAMDPDNAQDRNQWLMGIGTMVIGKAPPLWGDSEANRFAAGAMELCRTYLAAEELALERGRYGKGSFRMIRVSVLDSEGRDQSGVAMLRQEDAGRVADFSAEVRRLAQKYDLGTRELAYAVIADMMEVFERAVQEGSHDE